jgi:hypothetical protein
MIKDIRGGLAMDKITLMHLATQKRATCCKCGRHLESEHEPLAVFFVMDKQGKFYCTDCDVEFKDGDERIFELDLEEEV